MQSIQHRSVAAFGAVLATFVSIAAVSPARAAETNQAIVSYSDLDLASPTDAARLDRRIRVAAARVCGPVEPSRRLKVLACRQTAIADARANLPRRAPATLLAAR